MFVPRSPTLEDYWRGIILLGRNVASYKFALAKALLELRPLPDQLVKLDELALPFARHVAAHLKLGKQGTFGISQFLVGSCCGARWTISVSILWGCCCSSCICRLFSPAWDGDALRRAR